MYIVSFTNLWREKSWEISSLALRYRGDYKCQQTSRIYHIISHCALSSFWILHYQNKHSLSSSVCV